MDIGDAVKVLKAGGRVRRVHWNGPHMWLALTPGQRIPAEKFWNVHNRMLAEAQPDGHAEVLPYVTMKTVENKVVPWLCSQTDLLADDWEAL